MLYGLILGKPSAPWSCRLGFPVKGYSKPLNPLYKSEQLPWQIGRSSDLKFKLSGFEDKSVSDVNQEDP